MMMTNQNPMTMAQGQKLAAFLHEMRPDWDERGILPALQGARDRAGNFDLAIAAIRAAGDPNNRTPAVIGMDGAHWQAPQRGASNGRPEPDRTCPACHWPHRPGQACEHREGSGPTWDWKAARQALRDAR